MLCLFGRFVSFNYPILLSCFYISQYLKQPQYNQLMDVDLQNFGMREDTVFCGIFDGHGPYGHLVSKRVRDSLPLKLNSYIELACGDDSRRNSLSTLGSMNSEETLAVCCDEEPNGSLDSNEREKHPEIFTLLKESFLKAFRVMDKELRFHSQINSFCSGSTAVALIKQVKNINQS